MLVFYLMHFGIVIIGLFVDSAYSKNPKSLYHLFAFQAIEFFLLIPITIDFVVRQLSSQESVWEATGKSEKIKEIVFYVVLLVFWFSNWFVRNGVLRGYLWMRATIHATRICEGFYIVFKKNVDKPRKSETKLDISTHRENVDAKDIELEFQSTGKQLIPKVEEIKEEIEDKPFQPIFPIIKGRVGLMTEVVASSPKLIKL